MELLQDQLAVAGFHVAQVDGDWLVITRSQFDWWLKADTPYQTLSVLYHGPSQRYMLRALGRTTDQGTLSSPHTLVQFCARLKTQSACLGITSPKAGSFPLSCQFSVHCSHYAEPKPGSEQQQQQQQQQRRCSACHQASIDNVHGNRDPEHENGIKTEPEVTLVDSPKVEADPVLDPAEDALTLKIETQDILDMIQTKEATIPSVFQDFESQSGRSVVPLRSRPSRQASLRARPAIHQAMKHKPPKMRPTRGMDLDESRQVFPAPVQAQPRPQRRVKPVPWEQGRPCTLCDKVFYQRSLYYRHLQRKHFGGRYVCHLCRVKLPVPQAVMEHLLAEHPGSPLEAHCPNCQVMVNFDEDPLILGQHFLKCVQGRQKVAKPKPPPEKKPVVCPDCGKVFSSMASMRVHVKKFHSTDVPVCHKCGFVATDPRKLKNHLRAKHKEEIELSDQNDNDDDGPALCPYCACTLANASGLKRHLKENHETVKCPECDEEFPKVRQLQAHRVRVHQHAEFKCEVCSMLCVNHGMLQRHLKIHVPPTLKCKFCERMFRNLEGVKNHQRMHTGETPFKCDLCDFAAKSSATLCSHKKFKHFDGKSPRVIKRKQVEDKINSY
ncbi:hypothetical protein TCAL_05146 [Tigriopus californicus]|uniref:C2H2-type domain-containing protein n=1 Tax=Tigriopus californicus TaxID=6832 RepID=A0A553NQX5_TIGCA|nr:zinc finger protein 226-like [Tigriopus californicus]TRY67789.1 hypothetical protein TCAL_05146 [Tigriopus californicus]|eukprot:TCALIF_05146-PA protein Name:"Similar to Znf879 Zinc finger protein 879 (Mus musculus)" AED:0.17 eAED:0.17 QI:0/1/0.5/1/1/1/2/36/608